MTRRAFLAQVAGATMSTALAAISAEAGESYLSRASTVVLEDLISEHGEVLAVTFTDTVTLENGSLTFATLFIKDVPRISHAHDLNLRLFKRRNHIVRCAGIGNQNVEFRGGANPPTGDDAELAVIDYSDFPLGVLHHRGVEVGLVRAEATDSVLYINAIGADE
jgi:hypothetical protein